MAFYDHFSNMKLTSIGESIATRKAKLDYRFIHKHLPRDTGIEILEIGPGFGFLLTQFTRAGFGNYDVVEPNDSLREKAVTLGARHQKAYYLPLLEESDASYDVIILSHVFEHLPDPQAAEKCILEIKRVLKPEGVLFIASPDLLDWREQFYNGDCTHNNPTTIRRLLQLFRDNGLQTLDYQYTYSFLTGAVGYAISRLILLLTVCSKGNALDSKVYNLRTTFLRSFSILAKKAN